jgi:hypothetical protein
LVLSATGSIYLGFITEGRLVAVLITPSLGVPNWSVIYISTPHHNQVFWRRCRGGRRLLQGESRMHNLYFVFIFVLLYFIFACIVLSKIQKISFLYCCFYLLTFSLDRMGTPENTKLCDFTSTKNNDFPALLLRHLLLRQIFMRSNLLC